PASSPGIPQSHLSVRPYLRERPLTMLGVDIGGTFTDVVAVRDGRITVTKVPSEPADPARPVIEGSRRLGVEGSAVFNHASTAGLNAVITRRLHKVAFLTTEGFRDILVKG